MPKPSRYIKDLENVICKFLEPVKDIPFYIAIKSLFGCEVIPINLRLQKDRELLKSLSGAARLAGRKAKAKGIFKSRPNEVGNAMEPYVRQALIKSGLKAEVPRRTDGKRQSTGYPDIYVEDTYQRPTYLEVKTYNIKNIDTSQRAFYFSPPANKSKAKITVDARHLILSFQIERVSKNKRKCYVPVKWRIYSIFDIPVQIKHEFNTSNRQMYRDKYLLAEGRI